MNTSHAMTTLSHPLVSGSNHVYSIGMLMSLKHHNKISRSGRRALFALHLWQPAPRRSTLFSTIYQCQLPIIQLTSPSDQHNRSKPFIIDFPLQERMCMCKRHSCEDNYCVCASMHLHKHSLPLRYHRMYSISFSIQVRERAKLILTTACSLLIVASRLLRLIIVAVISAIKVIKNSIAAIHVCSAIIESAMCVINVCVQAILLYSHHPQYPSYETRPSANTNGNLNPRWMEKNQQKSMNENMTAALMNCRSIFNKPAAIRGFVVENDIDFIALVETWMKDSEISNAMIINEICSSTHDIISAPRCKKKKGGGLAVLFKKCFKVKKLNVEQRITSFEYLLVQVSHSGKSLVVMVIYRPPSMSKTVFIDEFTNLCELLNNYNQLLIMGDFNLSDLTVMKSIEEMFDIEQHVHQATHLKGHVLDLVYSRMGSNLIKSLSVSEGVSDHSSIVFSVNAFHCKSTSGKKMTCRSWKNVSMDNLSQDLFNLVSVPIIDYCQVNQQVNDLIVCDDILTRFNAAMLQVVNLHAPEREKIIFERNILPWYNESCKEARRGLRRAERSWKKCMSPESRERLIKARQAKLNVIVTVKKDYLREKFKKCEKDARKLWILANSETGRQKKTTLPEGIRAEELPNLFSQFFNDKLDNLRCSLTRSDRVAEEYTVFHLADLEGGNEQAVLSNFQYIEPFQIVKVIRNMPNKQCLLDLLPTQILKTCLKSILTVITVIINCALKEGLPTHFRHAIVKPILKKASLNRNDLNSYRPVSQLPFLSKVIEKIVSTQLLDHFERTNQLDTCQYAYKKFHSCETALLDLTDFVCSGMDEGDCVALVLLDLSSAFDTIDHRVLLHKLAKCGVEGDALQWINVYLTCRTQSVMVNGISSDPHRPRCGVPQGSVLGPMLFTFYIRDIEEIFKKHQIKYIEYADDLQLMVRTTVSRFGEAVSKINACISDLIDWFQLNSLSVNNKKTEFIIFGSKSQIRALHPVPSIQVGGETILPSSSVRNLGVRLDQHMILTEHIDSICKTAFAYLRNISRLRRSLDKPTCAMLVHALVLSRIEYCCSLFYGIKKSEYNKLQRIINASIRIVNKIKKTDSVSQFMSSGEWLSMEKRIARRVCLVTFSALKWSTPSNIAALLKIKNGPYQLRSSCTVQLELSRPKKSIGLRAFRSIAPRIINPLGVEFSSMASVNTFMHQVSLKLAPL